jgi:hypothetical protein
VARRIDEARHPDGRPVVTVSVYSTARIWDVTWATLVRGDTLRERVATEKLVGAAQEFADAELEDPILRGIDKDDPVARNPCLQRGPLSPNYWTANSGARCVSMSFPTDLDAARLVTKSECTASRGIAGARPVRS